MNDEQLIEAMLSAFYATRMKPTAHESMRAALAVVREAEGAKVASLQFKYDTAAHLAANHLEQLNASRAENARLRAAIKDAPHDSLCSSHVIESILDGMVGLDTIDESKCDCWKRDALGGDK